MARTARDARTPFPDTLPAMVLDWLKNAARYEGLAEGFAAGFRFLRDTDLRAASPGKIDIAGGHAQ